MLTELRVTDLGVIADLHLLLPAGMIAVTGETGAGKTLVVEAIELLCGGRADRVLVRPGATEAFVEGRFDAGDDETILARSIPAGGGRSRAYVQGRMAPVSALAEAGAGLVDLHGQHAHQSLLQPAVQRAALDAFGTIDTSRYRDARQRLAHLERALAEMGGDEQARAREIDLLRHQLAEIDEAAVAAPDEDDLLAAEEDRLGSAQAHREAAATAAAALAGDGQAIDLLGAALHAVRDRGPLADVAERLRLLQMEAEEAATDLNRRIEQLEDDPARLAEVQARRQVLQALRRKYGPTLADVQGFAAEAAARLAQLEGHGEHVAMLEEQLREAGAEVARAGRQLGRARRAAAPQLASAIEARLRELALPHARLVVTVGDTDPGDDVVFEFSANPGEPLLPLTKIASGGELARTMLACRLVLTGGPPTLVFDEVDAGIGGSAAVAVGRALARLADDHQVLVVTHLPQVAAFADHQIVVRKETEGGRTVAAAAVLDPEARVVELSRMLSGQPDSTAARDHAVELLDTAAEERGRGW